MMSRLVLAVLLAVTTAACGDSGATPQETVDAWLAATAGADVASLDDLVVAGHEALVAVVEAGGGGDVVAILEGGLTEEDRAEFWRTFAAGFAGQAGSTLAEMEARGARSFTVGEVEFRAVDVRSADADGVVIVRRVDGQWRVDLVATVLPALVRPLRHVVDNLGEQRPGALATAAPSLRAGLEHGPGEQLADDFRVDLQELIADLETG